ncbi:hypothetical protein ACTTAL_16090 [Rhodobacter capsulatus]|uniref:hypothetical protein n=1 Tax=Rhodobacter capsulatus TaxID=1061 RepID=UPI00103EAF10|nr:hypothetical protein [Rhodobacter capsulatus]
MELPKLKSFFRVSKRTLGSGQWVSKRQLGASGRVVVTFDKVAYSRGLAAATEALKERDEVIVDPRKVKPAL